MKSISEVVSGKPWIGWALFLGTLLFTFVIGLLAASIMERKNEAKLIYQPETPIREWEPRNAEWGKHFPNEWETFQKTAKMDFKSKHNGNKLVDALKKDPKLVVLWAGYGFSKDYNQPRGHAYAVHDIRNTLRTGAPKSPKDGPMPNTCWSCKSPDVPRVMNEVGVAEFYKGKWFGRGHEVVNSIGCADCHNNKTMKLQISRPALKEAFERGGRSVAKASHQEMRSLVCAQCHVEYYFKGKGKYLTFPWDNGTDVADVEKYYDEREFKDWTHKLSKAPMLKAQHPGYELFKKGIHGQRGLACADCHMPYQTVGGIKFTNHQIISPLANIESTCMVCHRESADEFRKNVYERQDKNQQIQQNAEELLVKAHVEAKKAWDVGATKKEMQPVLKLIRHAQWRWDYAIAGHGATFHAPLEVARIMSTAIMKAQEARLRLVKILASHGFKGAVNMPDISTKEKAQAYIGMNAAKLKADKKNFQKTVVPIWDKKAKARENKWN